jgi:hypothetical protein
MKTPSLRRDSAPPHLSSENEAAKKEAVAEAISTDLAPASAIAVLAKAETPSDALDAALKPIAVGVTGADDECKVRVQLMFPDGSLLPVELDRDTGHALASGLAEALNALPPANPEDRSAAES